MHPFRRAYLFALPLCLCAAHTKRPNVRLGEDALYVEGAPAPFLFGAEVQYFRARGGPGPNVPREVVQALWDKALDRVEEAHMNAVSFYIPWDFHEPVEGVFDFDGRLDRDGDGRPDYPSRNLRGFLEDIAARGIRYVMVRPGPYINAEWGSEGFGAVPLWFLDNYPEALATNLTPGKPRVATFAHPIYREHVRRWFSALYNQVLKDFIGPGKPIVLVQIDNETNYFWDSAYERDRSPTGLARYHAFLAANYQGDIARLNGAYHGSFSDFEDVPPPTNAGDDHIASGAWHYDWFHWHDAEIHDYYEFLRDAWNAVGLNEPHILFTRCDSFNAADDGLLPRLDYGERSGLALSTLNLYPKTFGTEAQSTLNTPMKGAHDAALLSSSHRQYYGNGGHWLMATETVGGWFPPTEVSLATRQHTYASLLGSGIKAMMIYYFHEGYNWNGLETDDSELQFDAPLDKDMEERPSFGLLERVGAALENGLGDLVATSRPIRSPVLIAHDSRTQYGLPGVSNAQMAESNDAAALFGLFRAAGALPEAAFVDAMTPNELGTYKLIVWNHPGYIDQETDAKLREYVQAGGHLVVIGDTAGDVKISSDRVGQVTRFATSPAMGWNDDSYLNLGNATDTLNLAKTLLAQAQIEPTITLSASGQEPFVHAWMSAARDHRLLYIENFTRKSVQATLRIAADELPIASHFTARYVLGEQTPLPSSIVVTRDALVTSGVTFAVAADGVDIWDLGPQ